MEATVLSFVKHADPVAVQAPRHACGCRLATQTLACRRSPAPAGVRESAPENKIKEAHRKIMIANHPDAGGSSYIATKVNEAKDMLTGKRRPGASMF